MGGSVINPGQFNFSFLKEFVEFLEKRNEKFIIVTGGGKHAREYVAAAKMLNTSLAFQDYLGILETRKNAYLLMRMFKRRDVYPGVPTTVEEILKAEKHEIIVMGGLFPGISTDGVTAITAELLGCKRVINITTVGALYDRDPQKPGAKKIDMLDIDTFFRMATNYDKRMPGTHFVFDLFGTVILRRSRIPLSIVPPDIKELEKAIEGKRHRGTEILP